MSFEFRKWRKFLFESEESQEEYQLNFIFSIENKAGIDRTEIVKFIRGIENVFQELINLLLLNTVFALFFLMDQTQEIISIKN